MLALTSIDEQRLLDLTVVCRAYEAPAPGLITDPDHQMCLDFVRFALHLRAKIAILFASPTQLTIWRAGR